MKSPQAAGLNKSPHHSDIFCRACSAVVAARWIVFCHEPDGGFFDVSASLLLTTYYLLLTTHYSLLTTHYSLLTTRYSLLATRYSLLTTHYSLLTTHYSLLTFYYLLRRWLLRLWRSQQDRGVLADAF